MSEPARPVEGQKRTFTSTPNYDGPRFGVTAAEKDAGGQQLYLATIYDGRGDVARMDGRRLSYGDAFEHAYQWSRSFGPLCERRV